MTITVPTQVSRAAQLAAQDFNPNVALTEVLLAVKEWKRVTEEEKTKQRQIRAWERTTLTDIRARKAVLMAYLDQSFDERRENFNRLFDALDTAMDSKGDVAVILTSITALATTSPFAELRDAQAFAAFFTDRTTTIDV